MNTVTATPIGKASPEYWAQDAQQYRLTDTREGGLDGLFVVTSAVDPDEQGDAETAVFATLESGEPIFTWPFVGTVKGEKNHEKAIKGFLDFVNANGYVAFANEVSTQTNFAA